MKITCKTLIGLSSTIKEIIDAYNDENHENIASLCYFDYFNDCRDETLRKYASDVRTCALDLFQQNPQLPEPPKPESDPIAELQQIRQWCIIAEEPIQQKQKPPASGNKVGDAKKQKVKKRRDLLKKVRKARPDIDNDVPALAKCSEIHQYKEYFGEHFRKTKKTNGEDLYQVIRNDLKYLNR